MIAEYLYDLKQFFGTTKPPCSPAEVAFPPTNLTGAQLKQFSTKSHAVDMMKYSSNAMEVLTTDKPALKALLRIVLCASASSAEVERGFSGGALIDVPKRNRLNPDKFQKLCIVRSFLIKCEKLNAMPEFLKVIDVNVGLLKSEDVFSSDVIVL